MYGLIIENVLGYLRSHFHPMRYQEIHRLSKLPFEDKPDIEKVYSDGIIPKIGKKASQVLQISEPEIFEGVGVYFVTVTSALGLRQTLTSIGRNFRDFIFNLDNCHDYFKLKFTRMRAPSFFVDEECETGLTVHYRSKRRGFGYYVIGQMKEIAKVIFGQKLEMTLKRKEVVFDTVVITFSLSFDNSAFIKEQQSIGLQTEASLPIRAHVIFEILPFSILFTENLKVTLVGTSLRTIMPGMIGKQLDECFELVRPLIELKAEQILLYTNNVFVFKAKIVPSRVYKTRTIILSTDEKDLDDDDEEEEGDGEERVEEEEVNFEDDEEDDDDDCRLQLRGTLCYMPMWKKIMFIGCPIIDGLRDLVANGLFINDLSMHDYSRDLMITSSQYLMEEKMTKQMVESNSLWLEKAAKKQAKLETSNEEMSKGWIPSQINLIPEKPNVDKLEFAPILMARIDRMDVMTKKSDPIDLIDLLDNIARAFDHLADTIGVMRVETADDFLAISDFTAGLKEQTQIERIATLALDLQHAGQGAFREPNRGRQIKFRISIMAGPVVAAVVGKALPKFCLFGPTMNDVERMLDFCSSGKIIIDKNLKQLMHPAFKFSAVISHPKLDCLYVEEKVNHISVSVIPILHAYSSFKAATRKKLLGIEDDDSAVSELDDVGYNGVDVVKENGSFLCDRNTATCVII